MRKLFARCPVLPTLFALLIAGSFFAAPACTAGEGASPTCKPDVTGDGNQHLSDGCNKFAACRADPLNENSPILPAEECCKDSNGAPFQGQLLKLCLYGYGEIVDLTGSSSSGGTGGAGGGK